MRILIAVFIAILLSAAGLSAATCNSVSPGGNWSDGTKWDCGHAPTIGDTAVLGHAMTVTSSETVGTSGAAGTAAITINTAGSLRIQNGVVLTIRGDVVKNGPVYLECGSTWEWDGSVSSVKYKAAASAHSLTNAKIRTVLAAQTTAGDCTSNPVTVQSVNVGGGTGTANGWFDTASWLESGQWDAQGINFIRVGDSTNPAVRHLLSASGDIFRLRNFTFTDSGPIKRGGNSPGHGNATFVIEDGSFTNTQQSYSLDFTATVARTTGTWSVQRNYFDKAMGDSATSANFRDVTINYNVFAANINPLVGSTWAAFQYNVIYDPRSGTSANDTNIYGDIANNFLLEADGQENPHWPTLASTTAGQTFTGNILQAGSLATGGDGFLFTSNAPSITHTVTYNLVLPTTAGTASGGIVNALGNTVTSHAIVEHNTAPLGTGSATANHGVMYNEAGTTATPSGTYTSYKSNLVWGPTAKTTNHFYQSGTTVTPNDNVADPAAITNNTCWNCGAASRPGKTSDGTFYDLPTTGTVPGANDVNVDPGFVDTSRNFQTAGTVLWGADGSVDGTLAALKVDPGTRIPQLIDWVWNGFAPTNAALATAGHDGGTIGAVAAILPPTFPFTDSFPTDGAVSSDWSVINGAWSISGGKLVQTGTGTDSTAKMILVSAIAPSADAYTQAKVYKDTDDSATTSFVTRYNNASGTVTFYLGTIRNIAAGTDQWQMYKYTGTVASGTYTQIGSTYAEEVTSGSLVRFVAYGSSLSLQLWNGSAWVTKNSATDATLTTAGYVGLRTSSNNGSSFDDFGAGVYVPTATMSKFPGAHVNGSFVY